MYCVHWQCHRPASLPAVCRKAAMPVAECSQYLLHFMVHCLNACGVGPALSTHLCFKSECLHVYPRRRKFGCKCCHISERPRRPSIGLPGSCVPLYGKQSYDRPAATRLFQRCAPSQLVQAAAADVRPFSGCIACLANLPGCYDKWQMHMYTVHIQQTYASNDQGQSGMAACFQAEFWPWAYSRPDVMLFGEQSTHLPPLACCQQRQPTRSLPSISQILLKRPILALPSSMPALRVCPPHSFSQQRSTLCSMKAASWQPDSRCTSCA